MNQLREYLLTMCYDRISEPTWWAFAARPWLKPIYKYGIWELLELAYMLGGIGTF
jgi:hypothetical protein